MINKFWASSIAVAFVIVILATWKFWLTIPNTATDLPYWYSEAVKTLFSQPYLWRDVLGTDGFGQYLVSTLFVWPVLFLHGVLSTLGIPFYVVVKLIVFGSLLVAVVGMDKLLGLFSLGFWAKVAGSFLFILNTYFLLLLDGGHIYLALAYSLTPLSLYFFLKSLKDTDIRDRFFFSFYFVCVSIIDPRVLIVFSIPLVLCLVWVLAKAKNFFQVVKRALTILFPTLILLLLIHFHWLLPSLMAESSGLPSTHTRTDQVETLSFANLLHTIYFAHPNWPENVFGRITTPGAFQVAIPILALLTPIFVRNRWVAVFLITAVFGIFLTKGANEPLGQTYLWLFNNVPGFILFRDPSKFYLLIGLSYAVLVGYLVDSFVKSRLPWKLQQLALVFILSLLILPVYPAYISGTTGTFSSPLYKEEYKRLTEILRQDQEFSRVLWIPRLPPLGYGSPTHPAVEAIYLPEKRTFAQAITGSYETQNYLRQPYIGEILDITGIKYLAYPFVDPRRDDTHPDTLNYHKEFLEYLHNTPWVERTVENSGVPLLETKKHEDKFFMTDTTWFVVGSESVFQQAYESEMPLAKNAFIFLDDKPGYGYWIDKLPGGKIFINGDKREEDLTASFIKRDEIFFPASVLDFQPNQTGWWKRETTDYLSWRNFLKDKYGIENSDLDLGGGWAVAEGDLKLDLPMTAQKGRVLKVRCLVSPKGGRLVFRQNNSLVGSADCYDAKGSTVRWFDVGTIPGNGKIEINTEGQLNVVNALAILSLEQDQKYLDKIKEYEASRKITSLSSTVNEFGKTKVSYQQVNPTKYVVNISGVVNKNTLVFSENYDVMWQLNGEPGMPAYGLINGFVVDKDGEYVVELSAQKYVLPGLYISIATYVVLIFGLIYFSFLKK